ncbi:MAG: DNA repair protein RadC [Chthonomonas sp.]|nr:DNA repair protein RadC [Chthonomonas sp.]
MSGETPFRRVRTMGLKASDAIQLLAVVLAVDEPDTENCESRARELLKGRQLFWLQDLSRADFAETTSLDDFEVFRIQCALELGRRIGFSAANHVREEVSGPESAYEHFKDLAGHPSEHFCALYLDSKGGVISRKTIHIGTLNMSLVGVREVYREAVRESACTVIVAHNHPSGDPTPSPEDIEVTRLLLEAGRLLDIELRDHIIVGRGKWVSLRRERML